MFVLTNPVQPNYSLLPTEKNITAIPPHIICAYILRDQSLKVHINICMFAALRMLSFLKMCFHFDEQLKGKDPTLESTHCLLRGFHTPDV